MGLDLKDLKLEFTDYLIDRGIIKEDLDDSDKEQSVSIFAHREEFKDFVQDKFELDLDALDVSISELSQLEIKDGKFVLPEDLDEEAEKPEDSLYTEQDIEITEDNFFATFLNLLFEDTEFVENADEDGVFDDEEVKKFLTYAGWQGDDKDVLTFDDVIEAYAAVDGGVYSPFHVRLNDHDEEIDKTDKVDESPAPSYGGGGGGGGGYVGGGTTTPPKDDNKKLEPSKMSLTQLEDEKKATVENITTKKDELNNSVATTKETMTSQKEALNDILADKSDTEKEAAMLLMEYYDNVGVKRVEIADKKVEIANFEASLVSLQASKTSVEGEISQLQASLYAASNSDDEEVRAQAGAISAAIEGLQNQLTTIDTEITTTTAEKEKAQTNLSDLETQLTEIETLNEEQQLKFAEAAQQLSEDTFKCINEYTNQIESLEAQTAAFETSLKETQDYLQKVEEALAIKYEKRNERLRNPEAFNEFDPTGDGYTWEDMSFEDSDGENINYGLIKPKNADPDEELPVLVWFPGSGEMSLYDPMKQRIYTDIFENYDKTNLETWNGYILCVNYGGWDWETQTAGKVDNIISDFSTKYKIDTDKISVAGYSLGGTGTTILTTEQQDHEGNISASQLNDNIGYKYRNGVLVTGYQYAYGDYDIPMAVFSDQGTSSYGSQLNYSTKPLLDLTSEGEDYWDDTGATHENVDYEAFTRDVNNNGQADIFEFLQGTLKDDLNS